MSTKPFYGTGTSAPEQLILYYTKKHLNENAQNKTEMVINPLTGCWFKGGVTFWRDGKKYCAEFDSHSLHSKPGMEEKDKFRVQTFVNNGYNVIKFRDTELPYLENCQNIRMIFDNYSKKQLDSAAEAIEEYLRIFGINQKITITPDVVEIVKTATKRYRQNSKRELLGN